MRGKMSSSDDLRECCVNNLKVIGIEAPYSLSSKHGAQANAPLSCWACPRFTPSRLLSGELDDVETLLAWRSRNTELSTSTRVLLTFETSGHCPSPCVHLHNPTMNGVD